MNNNYVELKERQQQEVNSFPMFFAFSIEQYEQGMEKLNVTSQDELISIGHAGFIRRTDKEEFLNMMKRHDEEFKTAIKEDKDGTGFIYEMFNYELANHEYSYTYDYTTAIEALNLTMKQIKENENLWNGFRKAKEYQEFFSESLEERIESYLLEDENEGDLIAIVQSINSYNGSLEHLEFYENDEEFLNEYFKEPAEAIRATFYGDYRYADKYVQINGEGNLDSFEEWGIIKEMKKSISQIAEKIVDLSNRIDLPTEIEELIEIYETKELA